MRLFDLQLGLFYTYNWSWAAYGKLTWSFLLTVEIRFGRFLLTVPPSGNWVWSFLLFPPSENWVWSLLLTVSKNDEL